MADVAITPTPLVVEVFSADILDAGGVAISDASANEFVIAAPTGVRDTLLLLKFLVDASGDTIVVKAGDRPPSQRTGLGDLSQIMAASDVRYVIVDPSIHLQDDGTIRVTCGDDGTTCKAFTIPKKLS